jgi:hypothetical protein
MKFQLVALPLSTQTRLWRDLANWWSSTFAAHSIEPVPSPYKHKPAIERSELKTIDAYVDKGFVHIIVVPCRDASDLQRRFKFNCRVTTLPLNYEDLTSMELENLRQHLEKIVAFETEWLINLSPTDHRHALLLPPSSFEPSRELGHFWKACDVYWDHSRINDARGVLEQVEGIHKKACPGAARMWVDAKHRRFKSDPSKHGLTEEERKGRKSWRFCYEVPRGFHYDVDIESSGKFHIVDNAGKRYWLAHANADPWGKIW